MTAPARIRTPAEYVPEYVPGYAPEYVPEYVPKYLPEYVPETAMDERDEIWSVHACHVATILKYCFMNEVRTRLSQFGNGRTNVVAESQ